MNEFHLQSPSEPIHFVSSFVSFSAQRLTADLRKTGILEEFVRFYSIIIYTAARRQASKQGKLDNFEVSGLQELQQGFWLHRGDVNGVTLGAASAMQQSPFIPELALSSAHHRCCAGASVLHQSCVRLRQTNPSGMFHGSLGHYRVSHYSISWTNRSGENRLARPLYRMADQHRPCAERSDAESQGFL